MVVPDPTIPPCLHKPDGARFDCRNCVSIVVMHHEVGYTNLTPAQERIDRALMAGWHFGLDPADFKEGNDE